MSLRHFWQWTCLELWHELPPPIKISATKCLFLLSRFLLDDQSSFIAPNLVGHVDPVAVVSIFCQIFLWNFYNFDFSYFKGLKAGFWFLLAFNWPINILWRFRKIGFLIEKLFFKTSLNFFQVLRSRDQCDRVWYYIGLIRSLLQCLDSRWTTYISPLLA